MGHEGKIALRSGALNRANTHVSRLDIVLHAKGPHRARERYEFDHLAAAIGVRSKLLPPPRSLFASQDQRVCKPSGIRRDSFPAPAVLD